MRAIWLMGWLAVGSSTLSFARADEPVSKTSTSAGDEQKQPSYEMLHSYLLDQARQQFQARRTAIAAMKTPEDIARRQKDLRAFFLRSLGD
jgi:hypothetical protein